jgi:hypothetical protein
MIWRSIARLPRASGRASTRLRRSPALAGNEAFGIEQSAKRRAFIVCPQPTAGASDLDDEDTRPNTLLSLLCSGRGIPGNESSPKRATDLRELRPHRFSERQSVQVPVPEVSGSEFLSQDSPLATELGRRFSSN